jgi:UDP-4-amino-4,6-dideoxy-N-acetyl-beta-L-altrosamine N-acetyltransferase
MNSACGVRNLRRDDLATVLAWRNHPEVRRHMLSQHEISLEEHLAWFERVSQDTSRCLLIVEEDDAPLGFVHFSGVRPGAVSDWGFYAVPDAPRGTGRKLGHAALSHAFGPLKLHKVFGQVLGDNAASLRFHENLGFTREGVLRQHAMVNGQHHDMVCFGILREEWLSRPKG